MRSSNAVSLHEVDAISVEQFGRRRFRQNYETPLNHCGMTIGSICHSVDFAYQIEKINVS
jgi:hypothetical protein